MAKCPNLRPEGQSGLGKLQAPFDSQKPGAPERTHCGEAVQTKFPSREQPETLKTSASPNQVLLVMSKSVALMDGGDASSIAGETQARRSARMSLQRRHVAFRCQLPNDS